MDYVLMEAPLQNALCLSVCLTVQLSCPLPLTRERKAEQPNIDVTVVNVTDNSRTSFEIKSSRSRQGHRVVRQNKQKLEILSIVESLLNRPILTSTDLGEIYGTQS